MIEPHKLIDTIETCENELPTPIFAQILQAFSRDLLSDSVETLIANAN